MSIDKTKTYEVIDWRIYDPSNSFFKSKASDKSSVTKVFCYNKDNCGLYKMGTCVKSGVFTEKCEYGYSRKNEGYSRRASKYRQFIDENRDLVRGIPQLSSPEKKMTRVGDFIYFPYSYWSFENNQIPSDLKTGVFGDCKMIPIENFNDVDFLNSVLSHRPRAVFGGEITDYQKFEVPKMKQHLMEVFPDIYQKLVKEYPQYIVEKINVIGRKALIKTLKKGAKFNLKSYGDFEWDGEKIISKNFKALLFPIKGKFEVNLYPDENETIKITSEDQVDNNTKYLD